MKFGDKVGNIMDPKDVRDFRFLSSSSRYSVYMETLLKSANQKLKKIIKNNEALKKKTRDTLPSSICADRVPIKKKRVD